MESARERAAADLDAGVAGWTAAALVVLGWLLALALLVWIVRPLGWGIETWLTVPSGAIERHSRRSNRRRARLPSAPRRPQ
jgi:hypothetical protein